MLDDVAGIEQSGACLTCMRALKAYFRHLTKWFSPTGTMAGATRRQSSNTSGQRSLKRQPSGSCSREGTTPGMVRSRPPPLFSAQDRDRPQQPDGVGILGAGVEGPGVGVFHHPAGIHDGDMLGHLGDDPEVVGDEEDRGPGFRLEFVHEVQDLGLDGDVERRGRLVGDHQLRVAGERHGDHHALAHAAAHLVRVVVDALLGRRDADQLEHIDRPFARRRARELLVQADDLLHLVAHRVGRVEGGHGLLKDHGDAVAADAAHLGLGQLHQVLPLEQDLAAGDPARRGGDETHDGVGGDALAAAGLAHQAQGLAGQNGQAHVVDRLGGVAAHREIGPQVLDLEQRGGDHGVSPSTAGRARPATRRPGD